jgi:hypothetical protein
MANVSALVGRDSERIMLAEALRRCRSGRGGVVLISGEAGIGKTRLVDEVFGEWDGDVVRSTAERGGPAYAPLAKVASWIAGGGMLRRSTTALPAARLVGQLTPHAGDELESGDQGAGFLAAQAGWVDWIGTELVQYVTPGTFGRLKIAIVEGVFTTAEDTPKFGESTKW